MLRSIAIKDFILIDEVLLDLSEGMTAITGETGAGKSLLLSAIEFALGAKIETKLIRQGCASSSVAVEFSYQPGSVAESLQNAGIQADDNLIIRRTLSLDGKSRAFINDQIVSAKFAQSIFANLLEVHGQRDSILSPEMQLMALDQFSEVCLKRKELANIFQKKSQKQNALALVDSELECVSAEQNYVASCIKELEDANIVENEEGDLLQHRASVKNFSKLQNLIAAAEKFCCIENLLEAQKIITRNVNLHPGFQEISAAIETAAASIDNVLTKLGALRNETGQVNKSADEIEERLMLLRGLARKHNCNVDSLPKTLEDMKLKVFENNSLKNKRDCVKIELDEMRSQYDKLANEITAKRTEAASRLSSLVNANLSALRLAQSKFQVSVERTQKPGSTGQDDVSFLVSTNPGLPLSRLNKIASGGEAARIMLAIKVALAKTMDIPTFIFDEIDSGTSGVTASVIGFMLDAMSSHKQVLVITHSPQVAVYAQKHLSVSKSLVDGQNITKICYIVGQERLETVAKMLTLDGNLTTEAHSAANMLFLSRKSQICAE
ncbi:MAG: DNA repair protein RecN [Holosporales bacterium]|jgi:DNA repair protein RecN (Recombination protein N)|nr:DNA repair protein RecN [Holosporales bacterium]